MHILNIFMIPVGNQEDTLLRNRKYSLRIKNICLVTAIFVFSLPINNSFADELPAIIKLVKEQTHNNDSIELVEQPVIDQLIKRLDVKLEILHCPWARCLKLLESGQADIVDHLYLTPQRQSFLIYIDPPYVIQNAKFRFYKHKNARFVINSFEDLLPLDIGHVRGNIYFSRFDLSSGLKKIPLINHQSLLSMAINRRVDIVIVERSVAPEVVADFDKQGVLVEGNFVVEEKRGVYIAVSKKSQWSKHTDFLSNELKALLLTLQPNL
ncbi:MAG: hypothetical protein Alis3KO_34680 [Aliiglaciecola sp.]